jgi:Flp pilus assembly protein TadG
VRAIFRKLQDERGQALVELAFVIPLLLLFLFGIIDFGLALNTANTDTNVANYAVREAAVVGTATTASCTPAGSSTATTETTLQAWALCEEGASGSGAPTVCVADVQGTSPTSTYALGDAVKVEATSVFNWASILANGDSYIGKLSPGTKITSSATMRLEDAVTTSTTGTGTNPFLSPTCTS